MLRLYYAPGACSMAAHIVLEEGAEAYEAQRVDLAKGEQRSAAYLKINPQGRVPVLQLDSGEAVSENAALEASIIEALKTVYDPEIPVDIWELGLVYSIDVTPEKDVTIRMTLTAPACPAAEMLPPEVEQKAAAVPGVRSARVEIVWEPMWTKDRMSEAARLQLGFF